MIEEQVTSNVPRFKARQAVDDWLNQTGDSVSRYEIESSQELARKRAEADEAEIAEMRKTWGLLPEHQSGLRSAMGVAAGTIPHDER